MQILPRLGGELCLLGRPVFCTGRLFYCPRRNCPRRNYLRRNYLVFKRKLNYESGLMTTGVFFIISAWAIWSFDPIVVCLIGDDVPRSLISALALCTATCCLFQPLIRFRQRWQSLAPFDRRLVVMQGVIFTALPDFLYVFAIRFAHPGLVSAILRSQIGFAVLIAFFCLNERLNRAAIAGVGLIIAANIFLILNAALTTSDAGSFTGCLLALLAAILWAGATVTGKRLLKVIPPAELVAVRMAIASLALTIVFLGNAGWREAATLKIPQWLLIAGKGGLIAAPAFILYMHGLKRVPVYLASALEPLAVLFTIVTAFFILGRSVPPADLGGIFILLTGTLAVIFGTLNSGRTKKVSRTEPE